MRENVFRAIRIGTAQRQRDDFAAAFFDNSSDKIEGEFSAPENKAAGEILTAKM